MASTPKEQIAFIQRVAVNDTQRAAFVADPAGFAKKNKIDLDPGFAKIIVSGLKKVERDHLKAVRAANQMKRPGQPVMNALAAISVAAGVVQVASVAVSLAAAAYTATKWKGGFEMRGLAINPQQRGRVASTRLRNRIR